MVSSKPPPIALRGSLTNSLSAVESLSSSAAMKLNHTTPLLGSEAQALIECNQKLKELGIDETIALPQICVIGDQSTGKSSLIEAISTVQVPKAAGCCTQCPIAIDLSSGATKTSPWTCTVSIEQKYDFNASMAKKINKSNPLGPWQERKEVNVITLPTTHNKDEIGHLIRVAQAVILDPDKTPAYFLSSPEALQFANQVARFSPNVVRLNISEGEWPSLSFIDLPGVIANTGKAQDRYLVTLIRNLVQKYAHEQQSINMLTLPMNHDMDNCHAYAIIQELRVEDRTLAVFTKSDLASEDQKEQFLAKFVGGDDDFGFEHGYHSVMMPDKMSLQQAEESEAAFYRGKPWCDLGPAHKERLGVPSLTSYLRRLLFEKTAETLPGNLRAIEKRLDVVREQLMELPPPLDNSFLPWELQRSLAEFEQSIIKLFSAASTRKAWNDQCASFRSRLIGSRPTLALTTSAEARELAEAEAFFEDTASAPTSDDKLNVTSPTKGTNLTTPATPTKTTFNHRFSLDEIRRINQEVYSAFTQGEIDPKAVDEMNKLSVKSWNKLLSKHMLACSKMLHEQVLGCFKQIFSKLDHLEIYSVMEECIKKHIDKTFQDEWDLADEVCRREQTRPFTMDSDSLKAKEDFCVEERRRKRAQFRSRLVKASLDKAEKQKRVKRDEAKECNLEPDEYDRELQMSAKTRAYYEVASCRFTDIIGQSIFYNLLPKCMEPMLRKLREYLEIDDKTKHHQIISWMAEDKEREALRRRLRHEEAKLSDGHAHIQKVLGIRDELSPGKRRQGERFELDGASGSPSKRTRFDRELAAQLDTAQQTKAAGEDDEMYD